MLDLGGPGVLVVWKWRCAMIRSFRTCLGPLGVRQPQRDCQKKAGFGLQG